MKISGDTNGPEAAEFEQKLLQFQTSGVVTSILDKTTSCPLGTAAARRSHTCVCVCVAACLILCVCVCVFQPQDEGLLHRLFSQSCCDSASNWRQVPSLFSPCFLPLLLLLALKRRRRLVNAGFLAAFGPRAEIDEGLRRLSLIEPAGETYMHEGMKAVSVMDDM